PIIITPLISLRVIIGKIKLVNTLNFGVVNLYIYLIKPFKDKIYKSVALTTLTY
ncbi:hypothetical protein J2Z44_003086, partial [Clostridium punense]|nr:hypothetical protein [Clostridium punense]